MGTRGIMGIRVDGRDLHQYNQFDTYPSGLGASMVEDIKRLLKDPGLDGMRELARALRVVDAQEKPSPEDAKKYARFTDKGVSEGDDWYAVIRNLQGNLAATLRAGVISHSQNFIVDSLFCEFAYIVNLDEETFEAYRGFQHNAHGLGRYSALPRKKNRDGADSDYWPCALVGTFPLSAIPDDWAQRAFPHGDDE